MNYITNPEMWVNTHNGNGIVNRALHIGVRPLIATQYGLRATKAALFALANFVKDLALVPSTIYLRRELNIRSLSFKEHFTATGDRLSMMLHNVMLALKAIWSPTAAAGSENRTAANAFYKAHPVKSEDPKGSFITHLVSKRFEFMVAKEAKKELSDLERDKNVKCRIAGIKSKAEDAAAAKKAEEALAVEKDKPINRLKTNFDIALNYLIPV